MATSILTFDELAQIGSTAPISEGADNKVCHYSHPTRENLAPGNYASEIVEVEPYYPEPSVEGEDVSGKQAVNTCPEYIDVYHRLTDSNGNVDVYRFRVYQEYQGILKWGNTMRNYGLVGGITGAIGLCENVTIGFGKVSNYGYIKERKLVSLPSPVPVVAEDDMPDDPPGVPPLKPSKEDRLKQFLEDDEFDDFLDEDEDDLLEDDED